MSSVHTIPLHIGDLITDIMHLSSAELGGYVRLLAVHYRMGMEGLPDDDSQLRRITGLDNKTWKNSRQTLLSFFEMSGDRRWVHGKVQKVLSEILSVQEQNRTKALKRWKLPDAPALPKQCHGNAEAMPSRSQKPEANNSEAKASSLPLPPLPDWLPVDEWEAFKDMRKRLRSTLTSKAEELAIAQLERLKAEGNDPKAVIEQSIMRGWKGFFPCKESHKTGGSKHGEPASRHGGFEQQDYYAGTEGFVVVGGRNEQT